jgi:flagellar motor protein MotB
VTPRVGSTKLLVVAIIWLVLLGLAVAAYKLIVAPGRARQQEYEQALAEYQQLLPEAQRRGVNPPPLPDDADAARLRQMTADLRQSLTGSTPAAVNVKQRVRLALDSFSGYAIFRSPEFARQLAAQGIGLDLVDDGADYGRRIKSLRDGQTPLAVFTIDALIKASAELGELPGTIVMVIDESTGADAMVALKQAVPNIDALNRSEARIVATPNSPSETLGLVVTARFSLPELPKDCWIDANGVEDVFRQFQSAQAADPRAFVLWEPFVSKALENPQALVVIDSSKFRGYIVDVLVAQRQFLVQHEDVVRSLVETYLRVNYERHQQAEGMLQLVLDDAKTLGQPVTRDQAERLVQGIWWKNTQENYAHMGLLNGPSSGGLQRMDEMIANITDVLTKTGAIDADPTDGAPNKLYYDRILGSLHNGNFHPGVGGGGDDETIRPDAALRALRDEEWDQLKPVATVAVAPLVFASGTATLRDQSQRELTHLAETLRSLPQYYLLVRGHARMDGDAEANRLLAESRAQAAAEFLIDQGVSRQRIKAVGMPPAGSDGAAQAVTFVLGQLAY